MLSNMNCFVLLLGMGGGAIAGLAIAIGIIALAGGIGIGVAIYHNVARKKVGSVRQECQQMKDEAKQNADAYLYEAKIEAKEEQKRRRADFDREANDRRAEWSRTEHRLSQREDQLAKRKPQSIISRTRLTRKRSIWNPAKKRWNRWNRKSATRTVACWKSWRKSLR